MLTRKQFFMMTAQYCLDAAKAAFSPLSCDSDDMPAAVSSPPDDDLFYEAMRNGIDPGTLDFNDIPDFGQDAEERSVVEKMQTKGGDAR